MADVQLREAERRWRTSGSFEDKAAVLRFRLRHEQLPLLHLQVAGFLGDPAAAAVAPSPWPAPTAADMDSARLHRVPELGLDDHVLREWACECAERVLPIFEAKAPGDPRARRAIEAGRARLRGDMNPHALAQAAGAARAAAEAPGQNEPARCAALAAFAAAHPHLLDVLPIFAAHDAQVAATGLKAARRIEANWQVKALIEILLSTAPRPHGSSS